jgi:peroxiredoxin
MILLLVIAAFTLAPGSGLAGPPKVGESAPDFELEQLNGGLVTLSEFRGKVVLLNFFGYD